MAQVDTVLVRMDRIGDLVVSLPTDTHPGLRDQRITWFITKDLGFIPDNAEPKRNYLEFSRRFSIFEFFRMIRWFKSNHPHQVIFLHSPWWVSLAAWTAGVPVRMGRKSQWHSFLFLNLGIRQKRSESEKHEADYNLELVERALCRLGVRSTSNFDRLLQTYLALKPPHASQTISSKNLQPRRYRVVHPGMGGSALNWPQESYIALIQQLAKEGPVVITGTASDQKFLTPIKTAVEQTANVHWLVDQLKGPELLDLLSQAQSVTGPSTGVLHLAASLGTPSFGIYSPRKTEHPRRWGPRGIYTQVVKPEVAVDIKKIDPAVMKEITVEDVVEKLKDLEKTFRAS